MAGGMGGGMGGGMMGGGVRQPLSLSLLLAVAKRSPRARLIAEHADGICGLPHADGLSFGGSFVEFFSSCGVRARRWCKAAV